MYYLKSHARIVFAFIMREMATRYSSPGGYLWAFIEPVAFISMMTFLIGAMARIPPIGDSFPLFYATGYLAFSLFRSMEGYLSATVSANKALMSFPVVAPIDAVVARLILQAVTSVLVTIIVIYGIMQSLSHPMQIDWFSVLEACSLAWSLAFGISMMNMVLFELAPLYQKLYQIITRPLMLLSGVFYIPSMMPHPFGDVLLYNPIVHIVMIFRAGFYGQVASDGLDTAYVMEITAIAFGIGMLLFTSVDVAKSQR